VGKKDKKEKLFFILLFVVFKALWVSSLGRSSAVSAYHTKAAAVEYMLNQLSLTLALR